jgi:hypothetical protein
MAIRHPPIGLFSALQMRFGGMGRKADQNFVMVVERPSYERKKPLPMDKKKLIYTLTTLWISIN